MSKLNFADILRGKPRAKVAPTAPKQELKQEPKMRSAGAIKALEIAGDIFQSIADELSARVSWSKVISKVNGDVEPDELPCPDHGDDCPEDCENYRKPDD